jgi:hypothetical protein
MPMAQPVNVIPQMNAVRVYFRVAWACRTPCVLMMDRRYVPRQKETLVSEVESFKRGPSVPERFDCDDFAFALKGQLGHGVGVAFGARHAWNIALCTDGVWHIEPQNGRFTRRKWALRAII